MPQTSKLILSRDQWKTKSVRRANEIRQYRKSEKRYKEKITALKQKIDALSQAVEDYKKNS